MNHRSIDLVQNSFHFKDCAENTNFDQFHHGWTKRITKLIASESAFLFTTVVGIPKAASLFRYHDQSMN